MAQSHELPDSLKGQTQAVIDIAPGSFPPLGAPTGLGVQPPPPGVHKHIDRVTGEVTVVRPAAAAVKTELTDFTDRPA